MSDSSALRIKIASSVGRLASYPPGEFHILGDWECLRQRRDGQIMQLEGGPAILKIERPCIFVYVVVAKITML